MKSIMSDPDICSGSPVLTGTRFPVQLILTNLAVGMTVNEIADDCSLDRDLVRQAVLEINDYFQEHFNGRTTS